MAGNVYLIQNDGKLHAMSERPYDNEDLLQKLLESYPELLATDQTRDGKQCRLLLVSREYGVPGQQEGADRWSVDHLFIDQDGVPTLVEVKRSTDTRIRREVVGQMLDYAANAIVYWPVENIRSRFEVECESRVRDPVQSVAEFLGTDSADSTAVEIFWNSVKTNLQAGKVRLILVADKIPTELQRIVEFLNSQMDPAEVIAVELRQFLGEGVRTLVPRVFGQTSTAIQKKAGRGSERRNWDEATFFADVQNQGLTDSEQAAIRKLYEFSLSNCDDVGWGTGKDRGSFNPKFERICPRSPYTVFSDGKLVLNLKWLREPAAVRCGNVMKTEITKIPGLELPDDPLFPSIQIRDWADKVEQIIEAFRKAVLP